MAKFVITAELQVRAPSGSQLGGVARQIQQGINQGSRNARTNLNLGNSQQQVSQIASQFRTLNASLAQTAVGMGLATSGLEKFSSQVGLAARRFVAFTLAAGSLVKITQGFRTGVAEAINFEREMVRLAQVGGDTASKIAAIQQEISQLSTSLGVSSKELAQAAVTFRQAGFSVDLVAESLETLALSALAPNFDTLAQTTEGMIAVMRQFNTTGQETRESIGAINAVAGAFAVEASDLITVVQKTGGAFKQTGGDLNQLLGLFTSIRSTTRESADSIATGLRTIFTRLQRTETVDALKALGINLRHTREEALALSNVGLENQFVGAYEAVQRLSEGLATLRTTDPRYAAVVEQLGGFRQVSRVIPLIQQAKEGQRAVNVAGIGQASLYTAAEKAQESLSNKVEKTQEKFLELFRTIVDSQAFQTLADSLLSVSNLMTDVLNGAGEFGSFFGGLKTYLPVLAAFGVGKTLRTVVNNVGQFGRGASGQKFNVGGYVVPGTGSTDTVPATLTPGEMVLSRPAVKTLGPKVVEDLRKGRVPEREQLASGGYVYRKPPLSRVIKQKASRLSDRALNAGRGQLIKDPQANSEANFAAINALLQSLGLNVDARKITSQILSTYDFEGSGVLGLFEESSKSTLLSPLHNRNVATHEILGHGGNLRLGHFLRGKSDKTNLGTQLPQLAGLGRDALDYFKSSVQPDVLAQYLKDFQSTSEFLQEPSEDFARDEGLARLVGDYFQPPKTLNASNQKRLAELKRELEKIYFPLLEEATAPDTVDLDYVPRLAKATSRRYSDELAFPRRKFNQGGYLVPGTGNSDTFPANLKEGSFVLRKSAVKSLSEKTASDFSGSDPGFFQNGSIPSLLTPGELVLGPDLVKKVGADKLHRFNKSPRQFAAGGMVQRFADGGQPPPAPKQDGTLKTTLSIFISTFEQLTRSLQSAAERHVEAKTNLSKNPNDPIAKAAVASTFKDVGNVNTEHRNVGIGAIDLSSKVLNRGDITEELQKSISDSINKILKEVEQAFLEDAPKKQSGAADRFRKRKEDAETIGSLSPSQLKQAAVPEKVVPQARETSRPIQEEAAARADEREVKQPKAKRREVTPENAGIAEEFLTKRAEKRQFNLTERNKEGKLVPNAGAALGLAPLVLDMMASPQVGLLQQGQRTPEVEKRADDAALSAVRTFDIAKRSKLSDEQKTNPSPELFEREFESHVTAAIIQSARDKAGQQAGKTRNRKKVAEEPEAPYDENEVRRGLRAKPKRHASSPLSTERHRSSEEGSSIGDTLSSQEDGDVLESLEQAEQLKRRRQDVELATAKGLAVRNKERKPTAVTRLARQQFVELKKSDPQAAKRVAGLAREERLETLSPNEKNKLERLNQSGVRLSPDAFTDDEGRIDFKRLDELIATVEQVPQDVRELLVKQGAFTNVTNKKQIKDSSIAKSAIDKQGNPKPITTKNVPGVVARFRDVQGNVSNQAIVTRQSTLDDTKVREAGGGHQVLPHEQSHLLDRVLGDLEGSRPSLREDFSKLHPQLKEQFVNDPALANKGANLEPWLHSPKETFAEANSRFMQGGEVRQSLSQEVQGFFEDLHERVRKLNQTQGQIGHTPEQASAQQELKSLPAAIADAVFETTEKKQGQQGKVGGESPPVVAETQEKKGAAKKSAKEKSETNRSKGKSPNVDKSGAGDGQEPPTTNVAAGAPAPGEDPKKKKQRQAREAQQRRLAKKQESQVDDVLQTQTFDTTGEVQPVPKSQRKERGKFFRQLKTQEKGRKLNAQQLEELAKKNKKLIKPEDQAFVDRTIQERRAEEESARAAQAASNFLGRVQEPDLHPRQLEDRLKQRPALTPAENELVEETTQETKDREIQRRRERELGVAGVDPLGDKQPSQFLRQRGAAKPESTGFFKQEPLIPAVAGDAFQASIQEQLEAGAGGRPSGNVNPPQSPPPPSDSSPNQPNRRFQLRSLSEITQQAAIKEITNKGGDHLLSRQAASLDQNQPGAILQAEQSRVNQELVKAQTQLLQQIHPQISSSEALVKAQEQVAKAWGENQKVVRDLSGNVIGLESTVKQAEQQAANLGSTFNPKLEAPLGKDKKLVAANELFTKASDRAIEQRGGKSVLSDQTQASLSDKAKSATFDGLVKVQARLLQSVTPQISSAEALKKAQDQVRAAYDSNAKIVTDLNGKFVGLESTVQEAKQKGVVPKVGLVERAKESLSGKLATARESASSSLRKFDQSGAGKFSSRVGGGLTSTSALLALPFISQSVSRLGGTSQDAVAKESESGFVTSQAAAGGVQGAVTGANVGAALGPHGAAAGALLGAIKGVVDGLQNAESEIRQVKIGQALTKLESQLGSLVIGDDEANVGGNRRVKESLTEINKQTREENLEKSRRSFLGVRFGGSRLKEFSKLQESSDRELFAPKLVEFVEILSKQGEELGKNNLGTSAETLADDLLKGGNGLNRVLLEKIADVKGVPLKAVLEDFEKTIQSAQRAGKIEKEVDKVGSERERSSNDFGRLVSALDAASDSLSRLQERSASLAESFEGIVGNSPVSLNLSSLKDFGRPDQAALEPLGAIRSAGGKGGEQLFKAGQAIVEVEQLLPSILNEIARANPTEGADLSASLRNEFDKKFEGAIPSQDVQRIINSVATELTLLAKDGPQDVQKAIQLDPTKLSKQLLSPQTDSVRDAAQAAGEKLEQAANAFANGLGTLRQQEVSVRNARGELSQLSLNRVRAEAEFRADAQGKPGQGLDGLSLEQLQRPLLDRQRELTGFKTDQQAQDPARIGRSLAFNRGLIPELEQKKNAIAKTGDFASFQAAALELSRVKSRAADLQQALENLADATQRNATIQEKLGRIQQERDSRRGLAERFVTADPQERAKLNRGLSLGKTLVESGKGLEDVGLEDRKLVVEALRAAGKTTLNGVQGAPTADNALNQLLDRSVPGLALPAAQEKEEADLKQQLVDSAKLAEQAQAESIKQQAAESAKFFESLTQSQTSFFQELAKFFQQNALTDLLGQQGRVGGEHRELEKLTEQRDVLQRAGVSDQRDVEKFKRAESDVSKFFEVRGKLKEIDEQGLEARKNRGAILGGGFIEGERIQGSAGAVSNFKSRAVKQKDIDNLTERLESQGFNSEDAQKVTNTFLSHRLSPNFNKDKLPLAEANNRALETAIFHEGETRKQAIRSKELNPLAQKLEEGGIQASKIAPSQETQFFTALETFDGAKNSLSGLDEKLIETKQAFEQLTPQITALQQKLQQQPPKAEEVVQAQSLAQGGSVFQAQGTDTVPAMLSPGEYVVNQASTQSNLSLLKKINAAKGPVYLQGGGLTRDEYEAQYGKPGSLGGTVHVNPGQRTGSNASATTPADSNDSKISNREEARQALKIQLERQSRGDLFRSSKRREPKPTNASDKTQAIADAFAKINAANHPNNPNVPQVAKSKTKTKTKPSIAAAPALSQQEQLSGLLHRLSRQNAGGQSARFLAQQEAFLKTKKRLESRGFEQARGKQADIRKARLDYQEKVKQLKREGAKPEAFKEARHNYVRARKFSIFQDGRELTRQTALGAARRVGRNLKAQSNVGAFQKAQAFGGDRSLDEGQRTLFSSGFQSRLKDFDSSEESDLRKDVSLKSKSRGFNGGLGLSQRQKKAFGLNKFNAGGLVPGAGLTDSVPAVLTPGEFVLPRDAVARAGQHNLQRFAEGGLVGGTQSLEGGGTAGGGSGEMGLSAEASKALDEFSHSIANLGPQLGGFSQSAEGLTAAFNVFANHSKTLSEAIGKMPKTLTITGEQNLNVTFNGAEVLGALMPEIQRLVIDSTKTQIAKVFKNSLPDANVNLD